MNLSGKYTVEITDKNGNKRILQTKNTIVKTGIRQVLDWLSFDLYNSNSFQGIKKVSADDLYFLPNELDTATSMYYPESVFDYTEIDRSDYFYDEENPVDLDNDFDFKNNKNSDNTSATIDNYRTGKQSITIGFKQRAIQSNALSL